MRLRPRFLRRPVRALRRRFRNFRHPSRRIIDFPKDLLWGAATSAHQVEGNNQKNDWWLWEQQGRLPFKSERACDQYERFEEDFDLAKSLGHNCHRFSIEWSRVEPREGVWDEQALDHYRRAVLALRARGLEPIVTLHHFTNPVWFFEKGGWERPDAPDYFARYARKVAEVLGKDVRWWLTINEPLVYVYQSFVQGIWPPAKRRDMPAAFQVYRNLILAHGRAYQVIHEIAREERWPKPWVSLALHAIAMNPCRPWSLLDRLSVNLREHFFLQTIVKGLWDGQLVFPGIYFEWLPFRRTLDFIGLNYYTRDFVRFGGFGVPELFGKICGLAHRHGRRRFSSIGWEIYPEGLYRTLISLKKYHLPVFVTENGIATENDDERWLYISRHLAQMSRAMSEGVVVLGYLYWSLIDNFEWEKGYTPRFGLVEMDYETQKRRVRPSAEKFADVCRTGVLRTAA